MAEIPTFAGCPTYDAGAVGYSARYSTYGLALERFPLAKKGDADNCIALAL
jgi:hypothetical protein